MTDIVIVADETQARLYTRPENDAPAQEVERVQPENTDPDRPFVEVLAEYVRKVFNDPLSTSVPATLLAPQHLLEQLWVRLDEDPLTPAPDLVFRDTGNRSAAEIAGNLSAALTTDGRPVTRGRAYKGGSHRDLSAAS